MALDSWSPLGSVSPLGRAPMAPHDFEPMVAPHSASSHGSHAATWHQDRGGSWLCHPAEAGSRVTTWLRVRGVSEVGSCATTWLRVRGVSLALHPCRGGLSCRHVALSPLWPTGSASMLRQVPVPPHGSGIMVTSSLCLTVEAGSHAATWLRTCGGPIALPLY
jgi:hypothetical protein